MITYGMQKHQQFRQLVLISNILGILALGAFYARRFSMLLFDSIALVLGSILFIPTIYLLIIFFNNKTLRTNKYDGFQLIIRLFIPLLIFYFFLSK